MSKSRDSMKVPGLVKRDDATREDAEHKEDSSRDQDEPIQLPGLPAPSIPDLPAQDASNGKVRAEKLSPRERFVKYRSKRLLRAEKALKALSQFGVKSSYEITASEIDLIVTRVKGCVRVMEDKLRGAKATKEAVDPFAGM